jgi:hypothetical protein
MQKKKIVKYKFDKNNILFKLCTFIKFIVELWYYEYHCSFSLEWSFCKQKKERFS